MIRKILNFFGKYYSLNNLLFIQLIACSSQLQIDNLLEEKSKILCYKKSIRIKKSYDGKLILKTRIFQNAPLCFKLKTLESLFPQLIFFKDIFFDGTVCNPKFSSIQEKIDIETISSYFGIRNTYFSRYLYRHLYKEYGGWESTIFISHDEKLAHLIEINYLKNYYQNFNEWNYFINKKMYFQKNKMLKTWKRKTIIFQKKSRTYCNVNIMIHESYLNHWNNYKKCLSNINDHVKILNNIFYSQFFDNKHICIFNYLTTN
ncbi:hypothetical protein HZS_8169 [Henneguya salminicola]|nr:hypothetical protein HZS_8169 [Henneguya salminicola]